MVLGSAVSWAPQPANIAAIITTASTSAKNFFIFISPFLIGNYPKYKEAAALQAASIIQSHAAFSLKFLTDWNQNGHCHPGSVQIFQNERRGIGRCSIAVAELSRLGSKSLHHDTSLRI
jgi:hypothetical protein